MKLKELLNTDIHFAGDEGVTVYREDTNEYVFNSDTDIMGPSSFLNKEHKSRILRYYADFTVVSISESQEALEIGIVK